MGHLTVCPASKWASHLGLDWQKQDAAAHSRLIRNLLTMLELAGSCGTVTRPRHSGQSLVCVRRRMGCSCRAWDSNSLKLATSLPRTVTCVSPFLPFLPFPMPLGPPFPTSLYQRLSNVSPTFLGEERPRSSQAPV